MRPHIGGFGELPFYMNDVIPESRCSADALRERSAHEWRRRIRQREFVSRRAKAQTAALTVEVNLEPTPGAFDLQLKGKSGEVLPQLVALL